MIFPFSLQVYPLDNYPQGKLETFERNYSHLKRLQIKDIKSIEKKKKFVCLAMILQNSFKRKQFFAHCLLVHHTPQAILCDPL